MTNDEYMRTQAMLAFVAGIVSTLDLDEFIAAIGRSESIGPISDPTLYLQAADNLAEIKSLAQGLQPFQRVVRSLRQPINP